MRPQPDDQPQLLNKEIRQKLRQFARGIGIRGFDLLLIGDGSGTTYQKSVGWSCIAYDRPLKKAVVHAGAFSAGTNNIAELVPYLHAVWFHGQEHEGKPLASCRVAVISDSEMTVKCGNGEYRRKANACWWAGIEAFEKHGYSFHWHHVHRSSNIWNTFADALAGSARKAAVTFKKGIELAFAQAVPMLEATCE